MIIIKTQAAKNICMVAHIALQCLTFWSGVKVPLLAFTALDDPVVPAQCLPFEESQKNENIILAVTKRGGHVAWLQDWNIKYSFMDRLCSEFIETIASITDS